VSTKHRFQVAADEGGLRLDQVLPRHVPGLSRRKARSVIDIGGVFVDKTRVKVAGRPVRPGQTIEVNIGGAVERANETPLAPRIVHVDDHVIVVDKPAGLVTAPTPEASRGDLLDQLARQYGEVYLVHRLDLPTSGLLVFARTRDANKRLGDAFKMHDVDREYRAVAVGRVTAQTIDRPIDRRRAVTHVAPLETLTNATLVRVTLETGRTHQIRIHLAGIGHPVCGDRTHGGETERAFLPRPPRLVLHAAVLGFVHPATGQRVRWEAPLPNELAAWIDRLRPGVGSGVMTDAATSPDAVISFWFGDRSPEHARKWFMRDAAFDDQVRDNFATLYAQAASGELDSWRETARGALALVILLDQFPRNMFRDDPRAFATDGVALRATHELLSSGKLDELAPLERMFALMPLQHSEDRDIQRESVSQFTRLADAGDPMAASALEFAKRHADIVERFGRFPHRNAVLGRPSTPEELEFLKQPGSSF
jgi:23S rRNA pseudouridine1911/1915/1917 synthase